MVIDIMKPGTNSLGEFFIFVLDAKISKSALFMQMHLVIVGEIFIFIVKKRYHSA